MRRPLRAMPVLFACQGCERDVAAREVAAALDRRGFGEAYLAGREADRARARFPIHAIEGCEKRCAEAWLARIGVAPQRRFLLDPAKSTAAELERLAACLRAAE